MYKTNEKPTNLNQNYWDIVFPFSPFIPLQSFALSKIFDNHQQIEGFLLSWIVENQVILLSVNIYF